MRMLKIIARQRTEECILALLPVQLDAQVAHARQPVRHIRTKNLCLGTLDIDLQQIDLRKTAHLDQAGEVPALHVHLAGVAGPSLSH